MYDPDYYFFKKIIQLIIGKISILKITIKEE